MSKPPLTKEQQALRGKKITDMTLHELRIWIEACNRMEKWITGANKARRSWASSGVEAEEELRKRLEKLDQEI